MTEHAKMIAEMVNTTNDSILLLHDRIVALNGRLMMVEARLAYVEKRHDADEVRERSDIYILLKSWLCCL
jgi:hypothetical protein